MNITITTRRKHPVSDEVLYALAQQSFRQWIDADIQATWLQRPLEDFSRMLQRAVVFMAIDEERDEVVGMMCLYYYKKRHYAYDFYLATAENVKQQGVATMILQHVKERLTARGYHYIYDTTSPQATWSVRWHLKNGYRIKGYSMGRAPYSGSYQFRLQLAPFSWRHPSTWLWNKPLAPITARLCYWVSYSVAHLVHHRNGQLNWIGRLGKRLKEVRRQLWFRVHDSRLMVKIRK